MLQVLKVPLDVKAIVITTPYDPAKSRSLGKDTRTVMQAIAEPHVR